VSGSDFQFNIAKGKLAYYASLPATNDALIAVLLQTTGIEADSTMRDYDNLSLLLAGSSDELTATNYVRKTLSGVTVTVDDTNDWVDVTCSAFTWTALGGVSNQAVGKMLICYDDDTTGGSDTNLIPLVAIAQSFTTTGVDETFTPVSPGFFRAT
jgi:hypothetical protein